MARIAGINIPMNKHVWIGLTQKILRRWVASRVCAPSCAFAGVAPTTIREGPVTGVSEVNAIRRSQIAKFAVEGDLRREVSMNIKRPVDPVRYAASGPPSRDSVGTRAAHAHSTHAPARVRASRR